MNGQRVAGWFLVMALGLAHAAALRAQVDFSDFSDISPLTLNGTTATIGNPIAFNGANVLRLTDGLGQSGSAFLTQPISLAADASFSTFFSFQLTDGEGIGSPSGADGIVFAVQTVSNTAGGSGGGIGYAGISNSVGIEFDTFFNSGSENDPDGNHVGIDLDGSVTSIATASIATPFNDGAIWYAWVDYNGATDQLEVRVSQDASRPQAATLSAVVDLPSVLAQTDAFVGFTSGTGAGANDHDIRSWTFRSGFNPIGVAPEALPVPISPLGLVILGMLTALMGGLALSRRNGLARQR